MAKARRFIAESMKLVDFCIELRDSRIPRSSSNPNIDALIGEKPRFVLLTKSSLSDRAATEEWIKHLSRRYESIAIDSKTLMGLSAFIDRVPEVMAERLEQNRRRMITRPLRAMVLGITNVGKSTFFNAMSRSKKAKVENRPGVTRGTQWIKTPYGLELLDTPGLLWEKIESEETAFMLAATGAIRDEVFDTIHIARKLCEVLAQQYPELLKTRYRLDTVVCDGTELFNSVAKTPLEEWIRYLKTGEIRPDDTAPGLPEARERLRYYDMTPAERNIYDEHINAIMIQNDVLSNARLEGLAEGRIEGRAEGRAEGMKQGRYEIIAMMLKNGVAPEDIARMTGLPKEEISLLQADSGTTE